MTRARLAASLDEAWSRLMFYEQIVERPPVGLRLLLPVPVKAEGRKSNVGDEVLCTYERGWLRKRITQVERGRSYRFEVVEQALEVGGGTELLGGSYELSPLASDLTEVALTTRYASPRRPRWLWRAIEAAVCHAFHRHILRSMSRELAEGVARSPSCEREIAL